VPSEDDAAVPSKRCELLAVHSLEEGEDGDTNALSIWRFSTNPSIKSAEALGSLGVQAKAISFDNILQQETLIFSCAEERAQVCVLLETLIRDRWQVVLEQAVIPRPEVYQFHSQTIKLNRKMKAQDRVLVLSDRWLYNVEPARAEGRTAVTDKDLRWACPLSAIKVVRLMRCKDDTDIGFGLTLYLDEKVAKDAVKASKEHSGSKGDDLNDTQTFVFRSEADRRACLVEIARCFFVAKQQQHELDGGGSASGSAREHSLLAVDDSEDFSATELNQRRLSVSAAIVEKKGNLVKFTKGGKDSHEKYFELHRSGIIEWRDKPGHPGVRSARVISVSTDLGELKHKKDLTEDQKHRLITLQTTEKTLQLLAASAAERDAWVMAVRSVLAR
jgi:hypothetical protein